MTPQPRIAADEAASSYCRSLLPSLMPMMPLDQASKLDFPCTAYACFDHYGTGEGRTMGLLVMYANSESALIQAVEREFGAYYSVVAYVGVWNGVPDGHEALNPKIALGALDDLFEVRPSFIYAAKIHFNAA